MYIRYRAIDPNSGKEVLEIAEMIGITLNPEHHYTILSLAGNYMDVYFKINEDDYEKMIEEMCYALKQGECVYTIKFVGVMYDYNGYFKDSSNRLEKMNRLFELIKFKN